MTRQIPLDLRTPPALSRGDFLLATANRDALAMLDAPALWPQGRLLLIGPEGAGKSHIAAFWAAERGAPVVAADALANTSPDALLNGGALVVEDAERVAGRAADQAMLFHLWNLAPARGALLLLTARAAPRDWGLTLPDLRSRMDAMTQVRLGAPDEELLAAVLVKLCADRQLAVPPALIGWLLRRMDRDLGLARRLVAALDAAAFAAGGPVTRRMAADILDKMPASDA
ncbi:MAG: DnaA/Hda family protein [Paracoccus sp. (in: a-proteobacteria)]|uniref:DnaA ATPase domain-containing protein n=1 Tax=Paracoccus sp. TaxID=267 RepID=UPI0026DF1571|nr:DnaA/Hda family protein [Paracoccus sp. (in: a-proteobacteria)]MDO5631521.1 DnaA/Hda family protein [Paracoccus sp. (in: a-proteobacteria)]